MQNNIEVLNDVTKVLIDSERGFRESAELLDNENLLLKSQLSTRAAQRSNLVRSFQQKVRNLGGEPEIDGSLRGKVFQNFKKFTGLFKEDNEAALSAIDDGEDFLSSYIQKKLDDSDELRHGTRQLLMSARAGSYEGERFAKRNLRAMNQ